MHNDKFFDEVTIMGFTNLKGGEVKDAVWLRHPNRPRDMVRIRWNNEAHEDALHRLKLWRDDLI